MNQVSLIGRLTRDVELRHTPSGTAVAQIGLAVDRAGDKEGDEVKAGFFDVTFWGNTAETVAKYLVKGRQIGVYGELRFHQWQDKDTGANRSKVEINARGFTFCGSKDDNGGSSSAGAAADSGGWSDFQPAGDDDIPF